MHRQIFTAPESGLRLHGDCLLRRPSRAETVLVWPPELVAYRQAQGAPLPGLPPMDPDCPDVPAETGPVIDSPDTDTPYLIRPDAPPEFQRLALSAVPGAGATTHFWYVDGRFAGQGPPDRPCFVPLAPGGHEATVTDDLGRSARAAFTVRTQTGLGSGGAP
jgi:penicillin-binding protein 1C